MYNEFLQLHDAKTFVHVTSKDFTTKQKLVSLKSVSVLKDKRCSKLKGRTCADRRKKRTSESKIESASPTVHTDSVVLTAIVDVCERKDIAVADVPRECLNATMEEFILLKMIDEQVDASLKIDPSYSEHATYKKEKKESW